VFLSAGRLKITQKNVLQKKRVEKFLPKNPNYIFFSVLFYDVLGAFLGEGEGS
jgi:hypothetical protein